MRGSTRSRPQTQVMAVRARSLPGRVKSQSAPKTTARARRRDRGREDRPLAREAAERRERADRESGDEEARPGGRHLPEEPAHVLEVAGVHRRVDAPGSEEEERLEDRVAPDVEDPSR